MTRAPAANRFDPPRSFRRTARYVFLFTLCLYGATGGGSLATDIMTYEVTKAIVERGSVAMSSNIYAMEAHRGIDGRYYAPYGIGHAVYSVPFYLAGRWAERVAGGRIGRSESLRKAALTAGSMVAAAGCAWLMAWFAWALVGRTGPSVMTALAVACATVLWPYAKFGFNAPLATLCVLVAVYGAWAGMRWGRPSLLVLSGAGIGAALLVRLELALVALPIALWVALESRPDWRRAVRATSAAAAPALVAVLITAYYNAVRFGNPLDTGYLRDQTAGFGSVWAGALGLIVSPGGSVLLYSPLLVLGVIALVELGRDDRHSATLLGGVALVLFGFYASLEHWDADRSYGPRYLLPVIPLLCLPLARWFGRAPGEARRRLVISGLVLSIIVQLPGVLVDFSKVGHTPEIGYQTRDTRRWEWPFSAFVLNVRAAAATVPTNVRYLAGVEAPPPVRPPVGTARDFSAQFAHSLDFWWIYLFYLGAVSGPVSALLGGLSLLGAGVLLVRLRRAMAAVP